VEWLNPTTGQIERQDSLDHSGGERALVSPEFAADVAVRIVRN